ncbi:hypothetical protein ACIBL8_47975 [Streptomyces sp. NPDC050523]|uniref:hypothetical protein n=1 Tax=Streptomyces sp. NPDC050523 TaxID=3365622 RepID=UPI00378DB76C
MKDFADLADPRMNEAAWRALDLKRAYAARDRAAVVEHLAHLAADQLEYAGGVLITMCNDTFQVVLNATGRPCTPGNRHADVDAEAHSAPAEHEFAVTAAARRLARAAG